MTKQLKYLIHEGNIHSNERKVIFLLHGYGSNEQDLFSLKEYIPLSYTIISLRAPISLDSNSFAWYSINFENSIDRWTDNEEAIKSKNIILSDILLHLKDLNYKDRVSILGFSQGAILSWTLGIENPNIIKNILPLSGYYNSEITYLDPNSKLKVNCLSSHGIFDPVIPIDWARKGVQILKKNFNIIFKEYLSGHEIDGENIKDLIDWLNKN